MSKKLLTIVGMGPGNSHATARRFGSDGYRIAMVGRKTGRHETYRKLLADEGIESSSFEGDAGNENSLTMAFDRIEENLGPTDVLLYNVFTYRDCPPTALKYQNMLEDFRSNVGEHWFQFSVSCRRCLRIMPGQYCSQAADLHSSRSHNILHLHWVRLH
jgi:NAD(P)-dependent dehydrogenase (short-subunit alcohol dehydrogenase family)